MRLNRTAKVILETRILQYGFLGIAATFIHLSIAFLWLYFYKTGFIQANILGFSVAFVFSYLSQSKYVFKSQRTALNACKYFLVQSLSLMVALFVTYWLELDNRYVKTIIVVLVIPVVTFTTHKLWTFKINKANEL